LASLHNSFRLYLLRKREARFGIEDPDYDRRIYSELADLTRRADESDPQRWLELRYRARAADHDAVMALLTPERFRQQLAAGRATAEIQADIRLAFRSVKERRDHVGLVGLLLSRHEIDRRSDALGNCGAIVDAYLALGDLDAALASLEDGGPATKPYEVIDALIRSGRIEDARREFEMIEPIGKLLGTEPIGVVQHDNELFTWAGRVHHFREPDQILEAIERLTDDDRENPFRKREIKSLRASLRSSVALAVVTTDPRADVDQVMRDLKVEETARPYLLSSAAWSAHHEGDNVIAARNLTRVLKSRNSAKLSRDWRRNTALLAFRLGEVEAARRLYEGLEGPSLAEAESTVGEEGIKNIASAVIAHTSLAARLGERPSAAIEGRHELLRALERHLATVGRLTGEARNGRRSPAHVVAREVRTILIFLNQATGTNADGFYPAYQVRYAGPVLGAAIVEAAVAHGPSAFSAVMAELDAVTSNPNRLVCQWSEFRRQILLRAYEYDRDENAAAARVKAIIGASVDASTPDEQVEEIARNARAFALIGFPSRCRELLASMHEHTLGYALAPKKDPQYIFWQDVLVRASSADPGRRRERVEFMTRLLTGMARTEGRNAAYRLTGASLEQAAIFGPDLAADTASVLETVGLVSWTGMINPLLRGMVLRRPDLALVASYAWTSLVLPYYREPYYQGSETGEFIRAAITAAPNGDLEAVTDLLRKRIEVGGAHDIRERLLLALLDTLRARGASSEAVRRAIDRWREEAPPGAPEDTSSLPDPYIGVQTLAEFNAALDGNEVDYWATKAAERLILSATYSEARAFANAHPGFMGDSRVTCALARTALAAGESSYGRELLKGLRPESDEHAYWDRWRGGTKLDYYRLFVELNGDAGRSAAFNEIADDLTAGREWPLSLLVDMDEVLEVLSPAPDWAGVWDRLAEQLSWCREYRLGEPIAESPTYARTDEQLIAHFYEQAFSLELFDPARQARVAAVLGRETAAGREVLYSLIDRLLDLEPHGPAEGTGLLVQ
jgi:hypothetical protein